MTLRPKLMTVCPYSELIGTILSAPKVSPYMTRVLTTFAMVSPFSPFSIACCSGVSFIKADHFPFLNRYGFNNYIVYHLHGLVNKLTPTKDSKKLRQEPCRSR